MIDENNDPYVVEFNVRFGDPECQITIPLIATDVGDLLYSASKDKLSTDVNFHDKHAMTVVLLKIISPVRRAEGKIANSES